MHHNFPSRPCKALPVAIFLVAFCLVGCQSLTRTLAGTVRDARDLTAIAGARVVVAEETLTTSLEGRFEVSVEPGTYQVDIAAPGYFAEVFTATVSKATLRYEREVVLARRRLRGMVADGLTAQPVPGAQIAQGQTLIHSGQDGWFEVDAWDDSSLLVSAPGYLPVEVSQTEVEACFEPSGKLARPVQVVLAPRALSGTVYDAETGQPVSGTLVSLGGLSTYTDESGRYRLSYLDPGGEIAFAHAAYRPLAGVVYHGQVEQVITLEPWRLVLTVRDCNSGEALPQAVVSAEEVTLRTNDQGLASLRLMPGTPLTVTLDGYRPAALVYEGQRSMGVTLLPSRLIGVLRDKATGKPLPEALVQVYTDAPTPALMRSDAEGRFLVEDGLAVKGLAVKMPGYRRLAVPITQTGRLDLHVEPFAVHGIYIPFGLLTVPEIITDLLTLVDESELNAVVVDVKSDRARLAWPSALPLAQEVEAYQPDVMDLREFLKACQTRGIYTIARMVIFKDNLLAQKHPEWAVKRANGQTYTDLEGLCWGDPFRQEVRDYNIALALEVVAMGFDEVQFDYLRFPSDGQIGGLVYSQESTFESRTGAMAEFCAQTRKALDLTPAFFSADVFGLTPLVVPSTDMGIGQRIEDIAPYADYISPMAYPATYISGNLGLDDPLVHPYEVVNGTVSSLRERAKVKVRPWLQGYSWRGVTYGVTELFKQRRGADDALSCGWIYWNAAGRYRPEAFKPGAYEEFSKTFIPPSKAEAQTHQGESGQGS